MIYEYRSPDTTFLFRVPLDVKTPASEAGNNKNVTNLDFWNCLFCVRMVPLLQRYHADAMQLNIRT